MVGANVDVVEAASVLLEAAIAVYIADQKIKSLEAMMAVAEGYYQLYKDQDAVLREVFYNNPDSAIPMLINEMDVLAAENPDYAARIMDFWDATGPFVDESPNSGPTSDWMKRQEYVDISRINTVRDDIALQYFDADNVKLESDWTNYMFRFEEMRTDVENDIKFQKKMQVLVMAYFNVQKLRSMYDCYRKSLIILHIKIHDLFITGIHFS